MPLKGEAGKKYHREWMQRHRESPEVRKRENARRQLNNKTTGQSCEICGYSETTDIHHEGKERKEYILCPNCHALITRGLKTMDELVQPSVVQPTVSVEGLVMDGNVIKGVQLGQVAQAIVKPRRNDELTPEEKGVIGYDADGYPLYEL